jgi:hypothetical protein
VSSNQPVEMVIRSPTRSGTLPLVLWSNRSEEGNQR